MGVEGILLEANAFGGVVYEKYVQWEHRGREWHSL